MNARFGFLRADFDRRRLLAYITITLVFSFLGAFGTYEDLTFLERLMYWAAVNASVAVFMTLAGHTLFDGELFPAMSRYAKAVLAAAVGAIPGAVLVW